MNIRFLMGLPGSGKTTFALEYVARNRKSCIIDLDTIKNNLSQDEKEQRILMKIKHCRYCEEIIFDGLILTVKEVEYLSKLVRKFYSIDDIYIDIWKVNREQCLINDQIRGRNNLATETIRNTKFVIPKKSDFNDIKANFIKYQLHEVYCQPEFEKFFIEKNIEIQNKKYLYSDTWSLGGIVYGWDGSSRIIEAETPRDFTEFDDLLFQICPNITFLMYKKLKNETVDIEERPSMDYYTNCREAFYRCNLQKLYDLLKKYNLIDYPIDNQ